MRFLNKKNIVCALIYFLSGCESITTDLNIHGKVIEFDTNKPISNIQVSFSRLKGSWLFASYEVFETIVVDEKGTFHAQIHDSSGSDIYIVLDETVSSAGLILSYEDFQDKKEAQVTLFASKTLKDINENKNEVRYK